MRGFRQQILLTGSARSTVIAAQRLLGERDVLWIGEHAPGGIQPVAPGKARILLGSETNWVVFDAHAGFDANAFAAVSGTIRGGGGLVLLMPPLIEWAERGGRFAARLVAMLKANDSGWQHNPGKIIAPESVPADFLLTPDQERAVDAIHQVAGGHRRRPAILVADRGRGKSTALGFAAARRLQSPDQRIVVTAPSKSASEAVFRYALAETPAVNSTIEFVAPDVLCRDQPVASLLLVDEAAGIPVALLKKLLQHYTRVVFSTTVHGYEGAGQGFAIRFREFIDQSCRQSQWLRLEAPVRWSAGDPLEAFVFRSLLLDAEPEAVEFSGKDAIRYEFIDRDNLLRQESLLRQIFGLLVNAHYRTTPRDLQDLLDGSELRLLAALIDERVVGVLLYANEGGIDAQLGDAVTHARRRLRGHLLPQVLAAQMGVEQAPGLSYQRVIRIAVQDTWRRHGVGRELLYQLRARAQQNSIDLLGCSFGATPGLVAFWRDSGYLPVRVGMQREASSGAHAVLMISPLSDPGEQVLLQSGSLFARNLPHQLAEPLRALEPEVVLAIGYGLFTRVPDRDTEQQLRAFSQGERSYEDSLAALHDFTLWLTGAGVDGVESTQLQLLVEKVVQRRAWAELARDHSLSGRTAVLAALRDAIGSFLQ